MDCNGICNRHDAGVFQNGRYPKTIKNCYLNWGNADSDKNMSFFLSGTYFLDRPNKYHGTILALEVRPSNWNPLDLPSNSLTTGYPRDPQGTLLTNYPGEPRAVMGFPLSG